MKTFGLTGGVGMGKSTCARLLRARGIAVLDTDELARDLVQPGEPSLVEIQRTFGPGLVGSDGQLDRHALAEIVFADRAARERLEAILHPRIRERWQARLSTWREQGKPLAVVVIPLLFETKAESQFDVVICVACSAATQRERLRARGWTDEQLQQRIGAQLPVEEKLLRSHFVIWTEGGLDLHAEQLDRILTLVRPEVGSH